MDQNIQKPSIRFKGFTDAWEQHEFGDILNTHPFKAFLANPSIDGEFEVIQQGAVPIIGYANGEPFTDFDDIVLFGDHTVSIYKPRKPFFLATDGVKIVSSKGINGDFLYYMFEKYRPIQQGYTRHFLMLKEVHTSYPKSSKEMVMISSFLCKIDTLITLHQRKYDKLVNTKKALLDKMFPKAGEVTPKLRFRGFTDAWEQYKFSDLFATIKSGNRLPKDMVVKGDIPYVIARIDNNGIHDYISEDSLDYHSNSMKLFKAPSITFSIDNPDAIFVQETAYFTSNIMRVLQDDKYNLYQYVLFSKQLKKLTSDFNWSIKFSGPVVLNSEIRLPYSKEKNEINLEEVTKLGKLFYQLDHLITLHQRKYEKLQNIKKALLQKMFV